MDLALALTLLGRDPTKIDRQTVVLPGAWLPVVVRADAIPSATRARWMLARTDLPLDGRISAALDAGLVDEALALVARQPVPVTAIPMLDGVLGQWAGREASRLGLPAPHEAFVVVGAGAGADDTAAAVRGAVADLADFSTPFSAPRWSGVLVVAVGDAVVGGFAPPAATLPRAALPMLRIDRASSGARDLALRAQVAERLCALILDLAAPPAAGWPPWLRSGFLAVARSKGLGEGPSPRAMRGIRIRAGADAIARLLDAADSDPVLAGAVCAELIHPRRLARLGACIDLLRRGADSAAALDRGMGLSADLLAE